MATEAELQVPPDSTGQKSRILQVTTLINGVATTVFMQVIAVADEWGNPITFDALTTLNEKMLLELRAIRLGTELILNSDNAASVDLLEMALACDEEDTHDEA